MSSKKIKIGNSGMRELEPSGLQKSVNVNVEAGDVFPVIAQNGNRVKVEVRNKKTNQTYQGWIEVDSKDKIL